MKWVTHLRIARAIGYALGIGKELTDLLCEASISPDKNPDECLHISFGGKTRASRLPHHIPKPSLIMHYVRLARKAFLQSDNSKAIYNLGRALHYIQDMSLTSKFTDMTHSSRELEASNFQIMYEAINKGIAYARPSPTLIEELVKKIKPKTEPDEILWQATLCSTIVAKAVLSEKAPNALKSSFKRVNERHRKIVIPIAIGICAVSLIASLVLLNPLLIIIGSILAYLINALDLQ
jgi:hypothetical protein